MRYSRISAKDKQRLVTVYQNAMGKINYYLLADQLGIKKNSAYKIIKRHANENG